MASSPLLQLLQGYVDVASQRQQLIVSNMANLDTPGYHTKDLDFHAALRRAVSGGDEGVLQPVSQEVSGLMERPDGNNVNLDRESLLLSQTQLQYQMGVQLIKSEFHRLLSAIKEGN
ncbi:flagellar biosynthesis protein FlgB [Acidobacteria bacterium AB60]|nr:flagellar biosynthesis protein FlgB [Acidobacteria bacterium AB60]